MPFKYNDNLKYFTFESLTEYGVINAIFTRRGGSSSAPWDSLNVGGTVGDDPARVIENRKRAFRALGQSFDSVYDVWQVHGNDVICAHAPRKPNTPYVQADAILTGNKNVTLFMRFADCVPILLYDPHRKIVGLVHAGWQGTLKKVASIAVDSMQAQYGSSRGEILACIGPSIGAHHYEIGMEIVKEVQESFGQYASSLLQSNNVTSGGSGIQLDLWEANRLILAESGVKQIEISGICTACDTSDWYSHRAEYGRTGRFGALIAL